MRTASGLTLIAIGAILAFAVTTATPLINVHVVGWILILTGIVGMVVPRRGYGWLRRRMVLSPGGRGQVVTRMDETHYPSSLLRYPDTTPLDEEQDIGRPPGPRPDLHDPDSHLAGRQASARYPATPGASETIEEFTEE